MDELTDTGAVAEVSVAEQEGIQTDNTAGAEPEGQVAELDGADEESTSQKTNGQEAQDESEGKQSHQTTFEERLKQIEAKAEARLAEMQAKFEAATKPVEEKPFVQVNMDKVNAYLAELKEAITDAELNGDMVKALDLEDQVHELRASLKENEKKRVEWEKKSSLTNNQKAEQNARLAKIDEAAEFYRTQKNIPQETWDAAGRWISEQFTVDPILGRQFAEMIDRQGEMAAFKWADEYCQKNMGAGAKADKDAKEAGKAALTQPGTAGVSTTVTNWNALMELPGPDIIKFQKDNPQVFQKLKEAHFK